MAATYRCRRENSRPEPVFRYFSNDRAFASDLNAIDFDAPRTASGGVYACALIVLVQTRREVLRDTGVVLSRISFAYENINVERILHYAGLPSRSLGAQGRTYQGRARLRFTPAWQPSLCAAVQAKAGPDWARTSDPALIKRML